MKIFLILALDEKVKKERINERILWQCSVICNKLRSLILEAENGMNRICWTFVQTEEIISAVKLLKFTPNNATSIIIVVVVVIIIIYI